MSYLSSATHADITARPERIQHYYDDVRLTFLKDLGPAFSKQCEDHLKLAFCGVVAFDLKPYGASTDVKIKDLMSAPTLDCDNYVLLAWHLFRLMRPLSPTEVVAVGWNGGAVGNHAQMIAQTSGSPEILVDPTIGLAVNGASLDALARGQKFAPAQMKSFFGFGTPPRTNIADFDNRVRHAIEAGLYKASDLLYWVDSLDKFMALPPRANWLTPQAQ